MEIFFFWLVFSILAGIIASAKGRSGIGYFLISIILSPLIGIIAALAMPNISEQATKKHTESQVRCPDCAELILRAAKVCKHCGKRLEPPPEIQVTSKIAHPFPANTTTQDALQLTKYGISFDGQQYQYQDFKYDRMEDALAYARKIQAQE